MPALVDTNILVYRHDPRYPRKQRLATELLHRGVSGGWLRVPHQALLEFVAAVSRPIPGREALLSREDARREAEDLLTQFPVLYPNELVFRTALRGEATYGLSWFDAHLWAYADHYGLEEIFSEDFEHGRMYGTVRVTNPFVEADSGR